MSTSPPPIPTGAEPYSPGTVVADTYRIERVVLANESSQLYWARHIRLDLTVSLRVETSTVASGLLPRAERAIRLLERIRHANVVPVLDHWITEDGHPVFVTEFTGGETLARYMSRSGTLSWTLAARVMDGVLRALHAVHSQTIVHRNVTPDTVLLCAGSGEVVRLGGMTLAKSLRATDDFRRITRDGDSVGVPAYVSPEQLLGKEVDLTSDLYSVALLGYEMMAGRLPDAQLDLKHLVKRVSQSPPPPKAPEGQPEIPEGIVDLLMSALAPSRDERPPSASAFLNVLVRTCEREGVKIGTSLAPGELKAREAGERRGTGRLQVRPSQQTIRGREPGHNFTGKALVAVALSARDLIRKDVLEFLSECVGQDAVSFEVGQIFWFALIDPPGDVISSVSLIRENIREQFRHDTPFASMSLETDFVLSSAVLSGESAPPREVMSLLDALSRQVTMD